MKTKWLLLILLGAALSGCAGTRAALTAVAETEGRTQMLAREWKELAAEAAMIGAAAVEAEQEVRKAVDAGDLEGAATWQARLDIAHATLARLDEEVEAAHAAYLRSVALFEDAIARYKDAASTEEAVGGVVGTVLQVLLAALGISGVGGVAGLFAAKRRENEARDVAEMAAKAIEELKKTEGAAETWTALKDEMRERLSPRELALLDELRP